MWNSVNLDKENPFLIRTKRLSIFFLYFKSLFRFSIELYIWKMSSCLEVFCSLFGAIMQIHTNKSVVRDKIGVFNGKCKNLQKIVDLPERLLHHPMRLYFLLLSRMLPVEFFVPHPIDQLEDFLFGGEFRPYHFLDIPIFHDIFANLLVWRQHSVRSIHWTDFRIPIAC